MFKACIEICCLSSSATSQKHKPALLVCLSGVHVGISIIKQRMLILCRTKRRKKKKKDLAMDRSSALYDGV